MNLQHAPALATAPAVVAAQAAAPQDSEIFQQLGTLTRQLHDTLTQLGVMPRLQQAADGLPDARSRLEYIAKKTGEAAEKVLTSVEHAKQEHAGISLATREMAAAIVADPVRAVATGKLLNFVEDVEASTARIDAHLTDIMMAQDFHDLTGQVVARVVGLATNLEQSLVELLVRVAPAGSAEAPVAVRPTAAPSPALAGPVVDPSSRPDTVANQGEVDDLLASLGF